MNYEKYFKRMILAGFISIFYGIIAFNLTLNKFYLGFSMGGSIIVFLSINYIIFSELRNIKEEV